MSGGVVRVLDAWGAGVILVETVGVGQTELDIMNTADTVVMVLTPESGDAIQALKAGLLEVIDIFVVNKADREGANQLVTNLNNTIGLAEPHSEWIPPVLSAQTHIGEGVDKIEEAVKKHRELWLTSPHLSKKRCERRRQEFVRIVKARVEEYLNQIDPQETRVAGLLDRVANGEQNPFVAAWDFLSEGDLLQKLSSKQ